MNGNILTPIALFGWVPVVLALFCAMPPRRAVIVAYLGAWLFLPMAAYKPVDGLPEYTKTSATCVGVLLAAAIFDGSRLVSFRPRWFDLPMLVWCLCPFASSLYNDLGVHDGITAAMYQTVDWGLPYLIGRVYFNDLQSIHELAIGLFIGGLVYVPLCLWEIKMSPQLHNMVYGYYQHGFAQTYRFGGWRPMVFMQHGLMVGMWMCMTGLIGMWLWWTGCIRRLGPLPAGPAAAVLLGTAVLCKSTGALVLLAAGLVAMAALKLARLRVAFLALAMVAPLYVGVRASGLWDGQSLLTLSGDVDKDRAASLNVRMINESAMAAHAMQQPVFGWGGWGRNRIHDMTGKDVSITDGFWIITFGTTGLVGVVSFLTVFLLPALWLAAHVSPDQWRHPPLAPLAVFAIVGILFTIDCLPNAMINPIFTVIVGGISNFLAPRALAGATPPSDPAWGLVHAT
jgi:hypothetical protein